MKLGVLTTGFQLVAYGEAFRDAPNVTRLSGYLLFCLLAFAITNLVKVFCPSTDGAAELLTARRHHVKSKLLQAEAGGRSYSPQGGQQRSEVFGHAGDGSGAVARGAWHELPHLSRRGDVGEAGG